MFKSSTDCPTDTDKLQRTGSTESLNNFDIYEENILSSLFQGIPMQHVLALQKSNETLQNVSKHNDNYNNNNNNIISNKDIINNISNLTDSDNNISDSDSEINIPKLKCVNVINNISQTQSLPNISKSILMKTGFREPNEIRIIFKKRPLGIQIKPHNIHGFGAKISKIITQTVETQDVKPNMIITGLNNKDLLGCTFDQIMNILKNANLPITLRLKSIHSLQQTSLPKSNNNLTIPVKHKYIHRKKHKQKIEITNSNSDSIIPTTLMLQSFSAENMPISTVLSSSSDEELQEPEITNETYLIRFHNGLWAAAVGKIYANLMEQIEQILLKTGIYTYILCILSIIHAIGSFACHGCTASTYTCYIDVVALHCIYLMLSMFSWTRLFCQFKINRYCFQNKTNAENKTNAKLIHSILFSSKYHWLSTIITLIISLSLGIIASLYFGQLGQLLISGFIYSISYISFFLCEFLIRKVLMIKPLDSPTTNHSSKSRSLRLSSTGSQTQLYFSLGLFDVQTEDKKALFSLIFIIIAGCGYLIDILNIDKTCENIGHRIYHIFSAIALTFLKTQSQIIQNDINDNSNDNANDNSNGNDNDIVVNNSNNTQGH